MQLKNSISDTALASQTSAAEGGGLTLLEQLSRSSSKLCPNEAAPRLLGVNTESKKAIYIKAACGLWSCEVCGAKNARQWVARTLTGVNQLGGDWQFWTLTAHRKMRGVERSLKNLRSGWDLLRKLIHKEYGKINYIRVFERHEDGAFHMHFLTDCKLELYWSKKNERYESRWLKNKASECGLGHQANAQPIENAGLAAWYVAKYLAKTIAVGDWPKNIHRVRTSNNWPKLPEISDASEYEWMYLGQDDKKLMFWAFQLWKDEIELYDVSRAMVVNSDRFLEK